MHSFDRNIFFFAILSFFLGAATVLGQSTNQNFPTPVISSEIVGTINARDVGDARLTSYFYQFDGDQGDLFINIVARNFTGDIDVFTLNGLRPLTKIVIYADFGENETGRVIYLRKPEKMLLRVQGRTPGDDPANFRIKFAGSFVASTQTEPSAEPTLPSLTAKNESGVRVNSVGTIVEIIPKATPTPAIVETDSRAADDRREVGEKDIEKPVVEKESIPGDANAGAPPKKLEIVVTDNIPEKKVTSTTTTPAGRRTRRRTPPKAPPPAAIPAKGDPASTEVKTVLPSRKNRGRTAAANTTTAKAPDPLEQINLVILFKDGTSIERPMSEVFRFTVDKGVLTVISKDGRIGRYNILDVAKVTIE